MQTTSLDALDALEEVWSDEDPSLRSKDAYPIFWGTGSASSSAVYFELEPGNRLGAHTHSSEETVLVLEGVVEATVAEERAELGRFGVAVVPPLASHDVRNSGDRLARCVGFFPSAAVVTVFEQPLMPAGSRFLGTPPPEDLLGPS